MSGCEVIEVNVPVALNNQPLPGIPELALCPPALRPALEFIIGQIPVAYVFLACMQHQQCHLLVVCGPECDQKLTNFEPLVELALLSCPISFTLHSYAALIRQLNAGDVYLTGCCRVSNLLYMRPGLSFPAVSPVQEQHMVIAAHRFEQGVRRALVFHEHAAALIGSGRPEMAAFHLHQTCEQCLRALFLCIRGRDLRTHSIRQLYRQAQSFSCLCGIFGPDRNTEAHLLSILETAYSASRYDDNYQISRTDLTQLYDAAALLVTKSCDAFAAFLDNAMARRIFEP